jgi:hypothetical protein
MGHHDAIVGILVRSDAPDGEVVGSRLSGGEGPMGQPGSGERFDRGAQKDRRKGNRLSPGRLELELEAAEAPGEALSLDPQLIGPGLVLSNGLNRPTGILRTMESRTSRSRELIDLTNWNPDTNSSGR